ncbi:unnamed protein product [Caretta caretta]
MGVNESTFLGWLKNADKLGTYIHKLDEEHDLQRKRARLVNDADLDSAMYMWFVQEQQKDIPISGLLIAMQGEKFDQELNGKFSNFKMMGPRESFGHPLLEENEESRSQSDEEFEGFTEEEVERTDMEWMQELC